MFELVSLFFHTLGGTTTATLRRMAWQNAWKSLMRDEFSVVPRPVSCYGDNHNNKHALGDIRGTGKQSLQFTQRDGKSSQYTVNLGTSTHNSQSSISRNIFRTITFNRETSSVVHYSFTIRFISPPFLNRSS